MIVFIQNVRSLFDVQCLHYNKESSTDECILQLVFPSNLQQMLIVRKAVFDVHRSDQYSNGLGCNLGNLEAILSKNSCRAVSDDTASSRYLV